MVTIPPDKDRRLCRHPDPAKRHLPIVATVRVRSDDMEGHLTGTAILDRPGLQGLCSCDVWSVAVICPALLCGRFDRWPRWVTRIGFQTEQ